MNTDITLHTEEQEAQAFLDSLEGTKTSDITDEDSFKTKSIDSNRKLIRESDKYLIEHLDGFTSVKDAILVKESAFKQIQSLEGNDIVDERTIIPMNVTFNIQNNITS